MSEAHSQTCPRRMAEYGPWEKTDGLDRWESRSGLVGQAEVGLSCSFCGSLHPDRFMELVRDGWSVGPTDKAYKAYLQEPDAAEGQGGKSAKFYFLHLSSEQQAEFIDLHNSRRMTVGYPGHFYVLPFFADSLRPTP